MYRVAVDRRVVNSHDTSTVVGVVNPLDRRRVLLTTRSTCRDEIFKVQILWQSSDGNTVIFQIPGSVMMTVIMTMIISIGSAVLAQLMLYSDQQSHSHTRTVDTDHAMSVAIGRIEGGIYGRKHQCRKPARFVQSIRQNADLWQTDGRTDGQTHDDSKFLGHIFFQKGQRHFSQRAHLEIGEETLSLRFTFVLLFPEGHQ